MVTVREVVMMMAEAVVVLEKYIVVSFCLLCRDFDVAVIGCRLLGSAGVC